jgi:hypothetical protein
VTPTTRSLRYLADEGWTADVVERRVAGNVVHDLFGFGDILAVRGADTLLVQVTTATNVSARVKKITDSPHLAAVREAGWGIEVHGWKHKDGRWTLRKVDLS